MNWEWRMTAQLELSKCLASLPRNVAKARTAADGLLKSALATSDPHLQALAWDLQARVALAESDLKGCAESIQQALALVEKTEIAFAAWQVYATPRGSCYQRLKEHKPRKQIASAPKPRSSRSLIRSTRMNLFAQLFSPQFPSAESLGEKAVNKLVVGMD